jgi:hypothetical protein
MPEFVIGNGFQYASVFRMPDFFRQPGVNMMFGKFTLLVSQYYRTQFLADIHCSNPPAGVRDQIAIISISPGNSFDILLYSKKPTTVKSAFASPVMITGYGQVYGCTYREM